MYRRSTSLLLMEVAHRKDKAGGSLLRKILTGRRRPGAADGPTLASLPAELLHLIMSYLPYEACLALSAVNWHFRNTVASLSRSTKRELHLRAAAEFRRCRGRFLCGGCGRFWPTDCFAETDRPWHTCSTFPCPSESHLAEVVNYERRCIECRIAAVDPNDSERRQQKGMDKDEECTIALGAKIWSDLADDWHMVARCPACQRAKSQRLDDWCAGCRVCVQCQRDWTVDFGGFCEDCASWRADALRFYRRLGFPDLYDPLRSGWYPNRWFIRGH